MQCTGVQSTGAPSTEKSLLHAAFLEHCATFAEDFPDKRLAMDRLASDVLDPLAFEKEKLASEQAHLAQEQAHLALEQAKLALEKEKLAECQAEHARLATQLAECEAERARLATQLARREVAITRALAVLE
jgi:hypothetical protein